MSEEKTELPSQKRMRDARRKGQFARSTVAMGTAPLFGAACVVMALGPWLWTRACAWTSWVLAEGSTQPVEAVLFDAVKWMVGVTAAPVVAGLVMGTGVAVAQAGLFVYAGELSPKLERVDPFKGLQRLFSARQLFEGGKGLVVSVVLTAAVALWLESKGALLLSTVRTDGQRSMFEILSALGDLTARLLALLGLLAVLDYLLARRTHLKSLMMSHDEVRREHKDAEGSPEQKAQRQALQRQLAMGGPARGIGAATALVVNPTHVAVALRYDPAECDAPYIVAKGRETDALRLRREAARLKIPIVRDIPLARSLVVYDVGEQVPEELYRTAAAVLRTALDEKGAQADLRS